MIQFAEAPSLSHPMMPGVGLPLEVRFTERLQADGEQADRKAKHLAHAAGRKAELHGAAEGELRDDDEFPQLQTRGDHVFAGSSQIVLVGMAGIDEAVNTEALGYHSQSLCCPLSKKRREKAKQRLKELQEAESKANSNVA